MFESKKWLKKQDKTPLSTSVEKPNVLKNAFFNSRNLFGWLCARQGASTTSANPCLFKESSFLDQAFLLVTCVPTQLHTQQETAALTLERGSGHFCFSWVLPGSVEPEVFHPWFNMDGWLSPLMINNPGWCCVVDDIVHCDCDGVNVHCGMALQSSEGILFCVHPT